MADLQSACMRLKIAFYLQFEMRCAHISNNTITPTVHTFNFLLPQICFFQKSFLFFLFTFKNKYIMQNTETGHAKNVANFEDFISFITGYGATYNPTKVPIKLLSLNTLFTTAKADILNVTSKSVAYNNATNARALLFEPLRPLSSRLVNAFSATDATTEMIKDAKAINRKIQGKRAKAVQESTDPNTPAPKTISSSQQSFDQLIEHFTKIIELLKTPEANYAPNEVDLKIATLTTQLAALKTANTNVSNAYTAVSNARIARDKTLYKDKTGLYDITAAVKDYVKSIYGTTAPEYKQISKIRFTKPKA